MSEYQYYEFQAVDHPLGPADQEALRALSTRARITATTFANSYEYGDFRGDPARLMESWFDLHLYLANWGQRRLMIRLPKRLVDSADLGPFLCEVDWVTIRTAGENLILNISSDDERQYDGEWDDGSGWLAALAPLRADILAGDLRLFYLLWLMAVETETFEADAPEPMPGIGPITGALDAFARFFGIDPGLVAAAAERSCVPAAAPEAVRTAIAAMADPEKTGLLARLHDGDPHVAAELRGEIRRRLMAEAGTLSVTRRTVGELRERAGVLRGLRKQAELEKAAAERRRQEAEAEKIHRARIQAVARRGESVWKEIETEIERRNAVAYDRAASLLADLQVLARERGTTDVFLRKLKMIRTRHAAKGRFIERLTVLGAETDVPDLAGGR